jgi:hypothetical protein
MRIEQTHNLLPSSASEDTHQEHKPRQDVVDTLGRNDSDSVELTGSGNALRHIVDHLRSMLAVDLPAHPGIPDGGLEQQKYSVPEPVDIELPEPISLPQSTAGSTKSAEGKEGEEATSGASPSEQNLSEEEQRDVERLKKRDREVRAHEQAHLAAAGSYATGGPTYEYDRGPDNRQYAVGGEVQIDTSPEEDPEATIRKAQTVRRAAQAPAEPSPQDRSVAASAARMESQARQELSKQRQEEGQGGEAANARGELRGAASSQSGTQIGSASHKETEVANDLTQHNRSTDSGSILDAVA